MRRGRIFLLLALILILGLVAVYFVWQRIQPTAGDTNLPTSANPTQEANLVNVVVTTQRVTRGSILEESVLSTIPMQQDLVVSGMVTDLDNAAGRQAKFDLESGTPLLESMMIAPGEQMGSGSVAALSIPRGMVAVSIPTDRLSSVSYAPEAGDHVNVILTVQFVDLDTDFQTILPNNTGVVVAPGPTGGEFGQEILTAEVSGGVQGRAEIEPVLGQTVYLVPSEEQRPRRVSQTLLQDAVVLRMGNFPLANEQTQPAATPAPDAAAPAEGTEAEQAPPPPPAPEVVTLIVTPQDAVTLNYLVASGARLTLALRSAGDDTRVETEAVTLQFLLDQYNIQIPVKLPYGLVEGSLPPEPTPTPQP